MKKLINMFLGAGSLFAITYLLGASSSYAQVTSGNAVVTVTLIDVMSLVVSVPAVPISYATVEDYQQGKTVNIPAQLLISSNRNFDVKVKSGGDLEGIAVNGNNLAVGSSIPISNLSVQATSTGLGSTPNLALSTADQNLVSNGTATMAKTIDISYKTPANSPLFVRSGGYTATLTYSIVPH